MANFAWNPNPIVYQSLITSSGVNTPLNQLAAAIVQTPSNADQSQLGRYNPQFYGLTLAGTGTANVAAMNALFVAMTANLGGLVEVPALGGNVSLTGTITTTQSGANFNNFVLTSASSGQGKLVKTDATGAIYINNGTGSHPNTGGFVVEYQQIGYQNGLSAGNGIEIEHGQNGLVFQCNVHNAPGACFKSNNTLETLYLNCNAYYDISTNNVNNAVGFLIAGEAGHTNQSNQQALYRCQTNFNSSGTGAAMGCQVTAVTHCTIFDSYFYGAPVACGLTPDATVQNDCSQITLIANQYGGYSQAGLLCQPLSGTGSKLQDFRVLFGQFQAASGTAPPQSVGIYIDQNSAATNLWCIDGKIYGAVCQNNGAYGMQINSGANIQVIGGTFAGNGAAGIYIGTTTGYVTISDADLSPTFEGSGSGGLTQTFAIQVLGNPAYVLIRGCWMVGYTAGSEIAVSGSPTTLIIKDCPGYNDVPYPIATTITTATTAAAHGQYSPSTLSWSGGDGTTTFTLYSGTSSPSTITGASGSVYIPSPYVSISGAGTAPVIKWLRA